MFFGNISFDIKESVLNMQQSEGKSAFMHTFAKIEESAIHSHIPLIYLRLFLMNIPFRIYEYFKFSAASQHIT